MAHEGRFVWYEHLTKDTQAAIAFYGEVIGWKTEPFGDQGYVMWLGKQGPLGGLMPMTGEAAEGVDDIHYHPVEPRTLRLTLRATF